MNEWEWQLLEDKAPLESISIDGMDLKKGDCVRLRPHQGGDIFDVALAGQRAIIETIEQDYEGKLHVAVVLEDDPGKDLGVLRQPGHRFFFRPDEIEPWRQSATGSVTVTKPRVLVAGIGNIFLGDDAFGVEVVRRLSDRKFPEEVIVRDFGIRGYDLAFALLEGYETAILIDACPRGGDPGTLYVIEPEISEEDAKPVTLDAHTMNPVNVIRVARDMGPVFKRIFLLGCEPATLGWEEGQMGLSEPVSSAIEQAVNMVEKLVNDALAKEPESKAP